MIRSSCTPTLTGLSVRPLLSILILLFSDGLLRADDGQDFFESKIRPILIARCYECHSEEADERQGGLWLDRRAAWQLGGDGGPVAIGPSPIQPKGGQEASWTGR